MDLSWYSGKTVFITGNTGFKGSWLSAVLIELGATVIGFSLEPNTTPNLFELLLLNEKVTQVKGDIRNLDLLIKTIEQYRPEVVIHLAAQPLVRESYKNPVYTFEINIMGTVNLCEAIRRTNVVKSFLNVTTDKVYKNEEWVWGYREDDTLNGYDPYSNSKSCSELVTSSYINSFFREKDLAVSTARAGNVIGGGDFSIDRIIPDCVCAIKENKEILIRNPYSIRPYQHVLEPIFSYLLIAQEQYKDINKADSYNIGPDEKDCITTGTLVNDFCALWGEEAQWRSISKGNQPHEANFLKLDCSKFRNAFLCSPKWSVSEALNYTVDWYKCYANGGDLRQITKNQMNDYLK